MKKRTTKKSRVTLSERDKISLIDIWKADLVDLRSSETPIPLSQLPLFRAMACLLYGHPPIVHRLGGYLYCARCEELVSTTQVDLPATMALVGHDCPACRAVVANLTEEQKMFLSFEVMRDIGLVPPVNMSKD